MSQTDLRLPTWIQKSLKKYDLPKRRFRITVATIWRKSICSRDLAKKRFVARNVCVLQIRKIQIFNENALVLLWLILRCTAPRSQKITSAKLCSFEIHIFREYFVARTALCATFSGAKTRRKVSVTELLLQFCRSLRLFNTHQKTKATSDKPRINLGQQSSAGVTPLAPKKWKSRSRSRKPTTTN